MIEPSQADVEAARRRLEGYKSTFGRMTPEQRAAFIAKAKDTPEVSGEA